MINKLFMGLAIVLLFFMVSVLFAIVYIRLIDGAASDNLSDHHAECSDSPSVVSANRMAPGRGVKNDPIPVDQYIYTRFYKRIQRLFISK